MLKHITFAALITLATIGPTWAQATPPYCDKLVAIIDDDPSVLDGMSKTMRGWGCRVVAGASATAVIEQLSGDMRHPDLIISPRRFADGTTGVSAIEHLRDAVAAWIPALLSSGETGAERLRIGREASLRLLHQTPAGSRTN